MEKFVLASMSEVREEARRAVAELHNEIDNYKKEHEDQAAMITEEMSLFESQVSDRLTKVESQLTNRLSELESRIKVASERIRTLNTSNSLKSANDSAREIFNEMKRRHALNLASRSHGASVISHLTSKATSSSSLLLNLVDSVFPLETYNFAITVSPYPSPLAFLIISYLALL
ncbi:unnamed protein product [Strongylus vulgaris]|uniref:Myosin tail domain-containing protein n=1 Tax=Strongylus vulgaris TaxID=40348 RepID=A0A3P7KXY3_STRVU|nr:unnamed protein product [Strongylus vulgaris]